MVVLEPSSCRAAKEWVLRRFAVAADCNSELAAEVGMFAAQVVRNHSPEQAAWKLDIDHRSKTIVPLSNLEVIQRRVEAVHCSLVVAVAFGQIAEGQMLVPVIQQTEVNHSKHSLPYALFQSPLYQNLFFV